MKMNYLKSLKAAGLTCMVLAILSSCSKDVNYGEAGKTQVLVNVGVDNSAPSPLKNSARKSVQATNTIEIPFSKDITLVASLNPVNNTAKTGLRASTKKAASTTNEFPLATGSTYTVLAYQNDELITSKDFTVGGDNRLQLEAGEYTFVTYSSGSNSTIGIPTGTLSLAKFEELAADVDLMYASKTQQILEGVTNDLNVVLKHLFTELTINFNTAALGDATIQSGTFSPSFSTASVLVKDGSVEGIGAEQAVSITFPTGSTTGQQFSSTPVKVIANTSEGVINLQNVSIGGVTKDVTLSGLTIVPNTRYVLDLALKTGSGDASADVGENSWSLGNLTFSRITNTYSFASGSSEGAYFFPDRVIPKNTEPGSTNQGPDESNGSIGDPCALISPANTWRLPLSSEITALNAATNAGGSSNPGPGSWEPARWVDYYNDDQTGLVGVFYGTQSLPAVEDRDKYLFVPFLGAYHDNFDLSNLGSQGYYLLKDDEKGYANGYATWHLTGQPGQLNWGSEVIEIDNTSAVQVVCVKNN